MLDELHHKDRTPLVQCIEEVTSNNAAPSPSELSLLARAVQSVPAHRIKTAQQALVDLRSLLLEPVEEAKEEAPSAVKEGDGKRKKTKQPLKKRTEHAQQEEKEKEGGGGDDDGGDDGDGGGGLLTRSEWCRACVALAKLSEAALPLRFPSLVLLPAERNALYPCIQRQVEERMRVVGRVAQLRRAMQQWWPSLVAYTACNVPLPPDQDQQKAEAIAMMLGGDRFSLCNIAGKVFHALSSSDARSSIHLNKSDDASSKSEEMNAALAMEREVWRAIHHKIQLSCAVNDEVWGSTPSSSPFLRPLQLSCGLYTWQPASRTETMRELLMEAEVFGLPPFLRSIRKSAQHTTLSSHGGSAGSTETQCSGSAALSPLSSPPPPSSSSSLLFLTPESLDPTIYRPPTLASPEGAHTRVQSELSDLVRRHCVWTVAVGDGDQIVRLLLDAHPAADRSPQPLSVKQESEEEGPHDTTTKPAGPPRLLHALAQRGIAAARVQQAAAAAAATPLYVHVEWQWGNRWVPSDKVYYALVLVAVIPTDFVRQSYGSARSALEVSVDDPNTDLDSVAYYVAAVVQLTR